MRQLAKTDGDKLQLSFPSLDARILEITKDIEPVSLS